VRTNTTKYKIVASVLK